MALQGIAAPPGRFAAGMEASSPDPCRPIEGKGRTTANSPVPTYCNLGLFQQALVTVVRELPRPNGFIRADIEKMIFFIKYFIPALQLQQTISYKKQNQILLIFCVAAMVLFYLFSNRLNTFKRVHINSDVTEYYSFVTATFECNDLSFSNDCPKFYWAQTTPNGSHVNKRSIGMAYMYTPFYVIAQLINGPSDDGYSKQTQKILVIGIWIYVCIGLFFLGKALYHYFSTTIVIVTLTALLAATNLIWYTNGEPLFTHGVNFMWLSILIYFTIKYHQIQKRRYILFIALAVSMLTIIRPNNILLAAFPILFGVFNKNTLKWKIELLKKNYAHLLLAAAIFFIPLIPQFLYWKYATGSWVYYSYQGEKFYWGRPLVLEVLFSFRKGWFIYTPVMLLSVAGIFYLRKRAKELILPVLFLFPVFLYVTSCWWAWSYGGCFGMRPMIDIYAMLAFPFAAFLANIRWYIMIPTIGFMVFCTWLNIFQAGQYSKGILHYDQMNKETYVAIWRKDKYPQNYDLIISYPDYVKEITGKGSYYQSNELTEGKFSIKFIRAKYLTSVDSLETGAKAIQTSVGITETFQFIHNYAHNRFLIRSGTTGLYLKLNKESRLIYINQKDALIATEFEFVSLGYNKFAMKAPDGLFVECNESNGFVLTAGAKTITDGSYMVIKKIMP